MIGELFKDLRTSTHDRGYHGIWGYIKLITSYLKNYVLSELARHAPYNLAVIFHRLRGVNIGKGVYIDRTVILDEVYPENITIEDDVRITAGAIIMTHIKAGYLLREGGHVPYSTSPVKLCKGCFIGVNATILPGVTVGECAVVVSGSVVMFDVPPYTVVSGNPAKKVRQFKAPVRKDIEH